MHESSDIKVTPVLRRVLPEGKPEAQWQSWGKRSIPMVVMATGAPKMEEREKAALLKSCHGNPDP